MKNRFYAYLAGSATCSILVGFAMLIWQRDIVIGLVATACYLAFCGVVGPILVHRQKIRGFFDEMTAGEWFLWPYCPIFLSPVFLGSAAAALDWQANEPVIRFTGIGIMFILAVPAFLLFMRLCEGGTK